MTNLSIDFCDVTFKNPLILPSGIAQEIPKDHERAVNSGAGGITTKSLTVEAREGYPLPRIIKYEHGFLNTVGFRGPGLFKGKKLIEQFLKESDIPVIVSVFAANVSDFKKLVSEIATLNPPLIELNLSCPHVSGEFGKSLGMGSESSASVVSSAKKIAGNIPIIAKLTPNIPNISQVAKACEEAGADAISAINTVGPGMVIDIKTKKPVLGNKRGGVSGPGIKPIAIRCVYDIYESVKIPIIGMGGVSTWEDTVEMIMAGATLVGVGSATYTKGIDIFGKICDQLEKYLKKENIKSITDIVGSAHKNKP